MLSLSASSMSGEEGSDAEQAGTEVTSTSGATWHFTPADTDLLVRLVKLSQKMGYAGVRGTWKEYLKVR